jgi:lipopolysaccharide/colanic/teichoic acid biosynthesis glycosyltransferase
MKRGLDVLGAAAGLVLLSPVILAVSVGILTTIGRPIFFRQVRPGLHGRPFRMIKFRTMRDAVGADGAPLPDADRLVPFGRLLRETSLDELPELWNVLAGDMSLVGPRPLLMRYLDRYTPEQARRHEVRPGVTGLAQVSGRNALSWDEKFALDIRYVDTRNMMLDFRILWATVSKVLRRDSVSAPNEATMGEFMGTAADRPRTD